MLKKSRFALTAVFLAAIVLIASALLLSRPAETTGDSQQANSGKCDFPESRYTVQGKIREFCEGLSDPLTLLGKPTTNAFTTPDGTTKQYFEHVVVVIQKDDSITTLVNLGELFWEENGQFVQHAPVATPSFAVNACKIVKAIPVCNEFLNFYQRHGNFIGEPVSEAIWENNELVQYFRYARLVLRNGKVTLSDLGLWYFEFYEPNKAARADIPANAAIQRSVTQLQITADIVSTIVTPGEKQTIHVWVQDQAHRPLSQAAISITLTTPDGRTLPYLSDNDGTPVTDSQGFAKISFYAPDDITGVVVHVTAIYLDKQTETQTFFRVWH